MKNENKETKTVELQTGPRGNGLVVTLLIEKSDPPIFALKGTYPLLAVETVELQTGPRGNGLAVTLLIEKSDVPERQVGTSMVWLACCSTEKGVLAAKEFIAVVTDKKFEDVTAETVKAACGQDNPHQGKVLSLALSKDFMSNWERKERHG